MKYLFVNVCSLACIKFILESFVKVNDYPMESFTVIVIT